MVSKTTLIADVYTLFYNYINDNVTDPKSRSKWIYPTWPDNYIDDSNADYPIIIVESPEPTWDKMTMYKKWSNISCRIEVYSTNSKQADELIQSITNVFDTKWKTFYANKIDKVSVSGFDQDSLVRGRGKRLHMRSITIDCRYSWSRT